MRNFRDWSPLIPPWKNVSLPPRPIYRISSFYYIRDWDKKINVTRVEIGSKIFCKQDNETICFGLEKMITIPPRHLCAVEHPVVKSETGDMLLAPTDNTVLSLTCSFPFLRSLVSFLFSSLSLFSLLSLDQLWTLVSCPFPFLRITSMYSHSLPVSFPLTRTLSPFYTVPV